MFETTDPTINSDETKEFCNCYIIVLPAVQSEMAY